MHTKTNITARDSDKTGIFKTGISYPPLDTKHHFSGTGISVCLYISLRIDDNDWPSLTRMEPNLISSP